MCDRVRVTSPHAEHSHFRRSGPGFLSICKECEQLEKELGPEPDGDPRVDAKPFQQWLLDFVATFDGTQDGRPDISAATFLGFDTSHFRRLFRQDTVSISTIDKTLTRSGRSTNLWELLPQQEQHQSTPKDPSG
jgi:hypothetical protein